MTGKVCLITGSTGIAEASARLAAAGGARVFLVGKDTGSVEALAGALSIPYQVVDLTEAGAADRAIEACVHAYGRLDALFNVAGGSGRSFGDGPTHECSDGGWDETLALNLTTTFRMCRAALRSMTAQDPGGDGLRGAILNMTSVLAFSPQREHFVTHAYAASKAGVIGLTRAMAAHYGPLGIRVNAIAPGLVRTPMSRRAQSDDELLRFISRKQPLSRGMLEADDIARIAVFLLSSAARATTGLVYAADGGWSVS